MRIKLQLSTKRDSEGRSEILLKVNKRVDSSVITMRAKSEVWTLPEFYSPTVGIDLSVRRRINPNVRMRHVKAKAKLDGIIIAISRAEAELWDEKVDNEWLRKIVEKHLHDVETDGEAALKTFEHLAEAYIEKGNFGEGRARTVKVTMRAVMRYEGFIRATVRGRKDFTFDVDEVKADDIEDFRDYLRNESVMADDYPELYEKLEDSYPDWLKTNRLSIGQRGENTIKNMMKVLRAFFNWLYETGRTRNQPFANVRIGTGVWGTPYYITIDERNKIADAEMPTKHLSQQRDVFVFHCLVGCRVGDLLKLTSANIQNGILVYTPHKTKDNGMVSRVARVPLHPVALSIIEKYSRENTKGKLLPFISAQRYNDAIKEVFSIAGITRSVMVRDALTGESILRPINEIASSHLARRTFIGNAYKQVADPNIIGKMSGHAEGSRAFARYRNIEDETLKSVIEKMG